MGRSTRQSRTSMGGCQGPRPHVPGRRGAIRARKSNEGDLYRARNRVCSGSDLPELTPEDQTQNKPDSERGKDRLRWIFAHVLLRVFLERAGAVPGIPPCLFCFAACFAPFLLCLAAIFFSYGACCRF